MYCDHQIDCEKWADNKDKYFLWQRPVQQIGLQQLRCLLVYDMSYMRIAILITYTYYYN